jgi:hypothetical protein
LGFELRKNIYLRRAAGKELRMDVMVREPVSKQKETGTTGAAPVKSG